MNQLAETVSRIPSKAIACLAEHHVFVSNRDRIDAYLAEFPDLASLLDAICKRTREVFGSGVELSLQVYNDPEIDDQYLTLYVRQDSYASEIIDRIEAVSSEFHDQLEAVSGYFLITTDFRRPRGADAV